MKKITLMAIAALLVSAAVCAKQDAVVVNVLTKEMYADCHIPGSINVLYTDIGKWANKFNKDQKIILYCTSYSCPASKVANRTLYEKGFTNVHLYEGAINEWYNKGYKTCGPCKMPPQTKKEEKGSQLKTISAYSLSKKIVGSCDADPSTKNFLLINVLPKNMFDDCRIPGSINVPDVEKWAKEQKNKGQKIILYCTSPSCPASKMANKTLVSMGFGNVHVYEGGMNAWYALHKKNPKRYPVCGPCKLDAHIKEEPKWAIKTISASKLKRIVGNKDCK